MPPSKAKPWVRPSPQVRLSTKSFGRDAAAVAASAFTALGGTLKEVDLSDCLSGRPEEEQKDALAIMCAALTEANGVTLHALDISDNALGEKGVRAARAALAGQPRLRTLALQNDGISAAAAAALDELLAAGTSGELRCLRLYNNMTGCEGAAHVASLLARCPQLEQLRLVSSRVGDEGGARLASALARLAGGALRELDLCDNGLGPPCGAPLAAVVAAHRGLTCLLLNDCGLCDSGVADLAAGLAGHPRLARLELCCNEIGPRGAGPLGAALATLPHLQTLRLAENELGAKGLDVLAAALNAGAASIASGAPPSQLLEVDFSSNELSGGAARRLAAALASRRCARLALDGNTLCAAAVAAVSRTLARGGGVLLPMEDNDVDGDEDVDELEEDEDEREIGAADALADALASKAAL